LTLIKGKNRIVLIVGRAGMNVGYSEWNLAFATNGVTDFNIFSRGGGLTVPLYLYPTTNVKRTAKELISNEKLTTVLKTLPQPSENTSIAYTDSQVQRK
jgi:hypothetical protein